MNDSSFLNLYKALQKRFLSALSVLITSFLFFLLTLQVNAQEGMSENADSVLPDSIEELSLDVAAGIQYDKDFVSKKLKKRGQKITVFGYYRLFLYGRNMQEYYPKMEIPALARSYSFSPLMTGL
ncbi:MAG: hypothetical protein LC664_02085 [Flavobacteriales bacterium]|nr:hypothetical protein [Flavobacteriales bacterium]